MSSSGSDSESGGNDACKDAGKDAGKNASEEDEDDVLDGGGSDVGKEYLANVQKLLNKGSSSNIIQHNGVAVRASAEFLARQKVRDQKKDKLEAEKANRARREELMGQIEDDVQYVKVHTSEGHITVLEQWFMEIVRSHGDRVPHALTEQALQESDSNIYLDGTQGITFSKRALQGVIAAASFIAESPTGDIEMGEPKDEKETTYLLYAWSLADFWLLPSVRMKCHEVLIRHIDLLQPCFAVDFGDDNSRQYDAFMVWMAFVNEEQFVRKGQMSIDIEKKLARCHNELMQKEEDEVQGRLTSRPTGRLRAKVNLGDVSHHQCGQGQLVRFVRREKGFTSCEIVDGSESNGQMLGNGATGIEKDAGKEGKDAGEDKGFSPFLCGSSKKPSERARAKVKSGVCPCGERLEPFSVDNSAEAKCSMCNEQLRKSWSVGFAGTPVS